MKPELQIALSNCHVCQCKLMLDPSLFSSTSEEKNFEECNEFADYGLPLRDRLDMIYTSNILEVMSNSCNPLEFPICKKCSNSISLELNKQLGDLEAECLCYKQALDQLVAKQSHSPFDKNLAKTKLDDLRKEEAELIEELKRLESEENALQKEFDFKSKERNLAGDQYAMLYKQLRENHRKLIEQNEENRSLRSRVKYFNDQLKILSKTQVIDLVFPIWTHNDYGTINNFRLGRLRHEFVDWNEINAAFGQIALLLQVLAEKMKFNFNGYEMCPCGSHSFIRTARGTELTLYGSGGWRPFGQPNLDHAIVAYMECFCQLENKLKSYFPQGAQILPYRMTKDMIVDNNSPYLVKMQLNSEERWTKAMKCLLSNLKRTIAIVANIRPTSASGNVSSSLQS